MSTRQPGRDSDRHSETKIAQQIADHPILIYMKGSPDQPRCGFSAQASQALMACRKALRIHRYPLENWGRAQLLNIQSGRPSLSCSFRAGIVGGTMTSSRRCTKVEAQTLISRGSRRGVNQRNDQPCPDHSLVKRVFAC
ncbi:MAG: glutaredoxin [Deltaproteobacteria bacterium]|nr:MAG: glutaredoxin [Deltaproteobacteria bacterium]